MDMGGLWSLQLMMFLLVAAGAILKKKGILKDENKDIITDSVLYFFLPCSIVNSFKMEFDSRILKNIVLILIISLLIQLLCYFFSKILYNKKPMEIKRVMQYCTIVSNSGFLGLPIAEGVFGLEGMMYASVFIIPMRIAMWTSGIACFAESEDFKSVIKKVAVHPCIVAVYIGLLLLIFQPVLTGAYNDIVLAGGIFGNAVEMIVTAVNKTMVSAGGCTTALTMILIGMMMADISMSSLLDFNALIISAFRLVLLPVLVSIALMAFNVDPFVTGVSVLISAMPAGSTAPILAAKYGCDYIFATKCVVVSTLLSVISIPLVCMILL